MKRFFIITFLSAISQFVFGQKHVSEITLPYELKPSDLQLIHDGDTLIQFVVKQNEAEITLPGRAKIIFPLRDFSKHAICGMSKYGENKILYLIEEKRKKIILKSIEVRGTDFKKLTERSDTLTGTYLGSEVRGNKFFTYSYERDRFELKMSEFANLQLEKEKIFKLPIDIAKLGLRQIAFFCEDQLIEPEQACANVKIINSLDSIKIVVDDPNNYGEKPRIYKTSVLIIDKESGKVSDYKFDIASEYFNSTIFDSFLFRYVVNSDYLDIQMFDLRNNARPMRRIVKAELLNKIDVMLRDGKNKTISKKSSLRDFNNLRTPYIQVFKKPNNSYVLSCGYYFNEKGNGIFFGPNLLVGLLTAAIITAAKQAGEAPGLNSYFYLYGHPSEGFELKDEKESNSKLVKQRIDEFELNSIKGYEYKNYLDFGNYVLAVYEFRGSDKLNFVRFNKK